MNMLHKFAEDYFCIQFSSRKRAIFFSMLKPHTHPGASSMLNGHPVEKRKAQIFLDLAYLDKEEKTYIKIKGWSQKRAGIIARLLLCGRHCAMHVKCTNYLILQQLYEASTIITILQMGRNLEWILIILYCSGIHCESRFDSLIPGAGLSHPWLSFQVSVSSQFLKVVDSGICLIQRPAGDHFPRGHIDTAYLTHPLAPTPHMDLTDMPQWPPFSHSGTPRAGAHLL